MVTVAWFWVMGLMVMGWREGEDREIEEDRVMGLVSGYGREKIERLRRRERERERKIINKWIVFDCVVKNKSIDLRWVVK